MNNSKIITAAEVDALPEFAKNTLLLYVINAEAMKEATRSAEADAEFWFKEYCKLKEQQEEKEE